jgi:hypothetical protein
MQHPSTVIYQLYMKIAATAHFFGELLGAICQKCINKGVVRGTGIPNYSMILRESQHEYLQ